MPIPSLDFDHFQERAIGMDCNSTRNTQKQGPERVLGEIRELLDDVERLFAAGAGAAEIVDCLYEDDALLVGEGQSEGLRGKESIARALQSMLNDQWSHRPQCRFVIKQPMVLDMNAAATFVEVQIQPNQGHGELQVLRALYGWTRTEAGWRIRVETYGVGRV